MKSNSRRGSSTTSKLHKGGLRLQPVQEASGRHSVLIRLWSAATTLMALAGFAYLCYEFRPKIDVATASSSLNPSDPFQMQFVVNNAGNLSIRNAEVSCVALDVRTKYSYRFAALDIGDVRLGSIRPGSSATVPCPLRTTLRILTSEGISYADVVLTVRYSYGPWNSRRVFGARFVTDSDQYGVLHWFPQPTPEFDPSRLPHLTGA